MYIESEYANNNPGCEQRPGCATNGTSELDLKIDAASFKYGAPSISVSVALPEGLIFHAPEQPLSNRAASKEYLLRASIAIFDTGLISIDMDFDGDSREIRKDMVKHIARHIYLQFKALFHEDTHHFTYWWCENKQEESIGVTSALGSDHLACIADAFDDISGERLVELGRHISLQPPFCKPGLRRKRANRVIHEQYGAVKGYLTYGANFLRIFKENLPDYEWRMQTFDNRSEAADALYAVHCNGDTHALADSMKRYSVLVPIAVFVATMVANWLFI
ncbi:MAG: hypothetical protein LBG62_00255 [Candidatus Methanoplasma sp.]|nr:hypothetical protein [Candidatus Methanoplasma sp.]